MACGVLRADCGGVQEGGGVDEVADEAEEVGGGEVDCETAGRAAAVVEDGLWVEGCGPAEDAGGAV